MFLEKQRESRYPNTQTPKEVVELGSERLADFRDKRVELAPHVLLPALLAVAHPCILYEAPVEGSHCGAAFPLPPGAEVLRSNNLVNCELARLNR